MTKHYLSADDDSLPSAGGLCCCLIIPLLCVAFVLGVVAIVGAL